MALGLAHFGARGYEDASVEEIANEAGISKGLVYHYFPTKKDYFAAAVREAARRLVARAIVAREEGTPLERVVRGIDAYLDYVRAHASPYLTLMRSGADPELSGIVDETRQIFIERITAGLADSPEPAIAARREDALMRVALRGFCGLVEASSVAWLEGGCAVPQARVRDLLVASLIELLRGVATSPPAD